MAGVSVEDHKAVSVNKCSREIERCRSRKTELFDSLVVRQILII